MYKFIWLYLSAFGIMFAVLSWMQESGLLSSDLGFIKGCMAVFFGSFLYNFVARKL